MNKRHPNKGSSFVATIVIAVDPEGDASVSKRLNEFKRMFADKDIEVDVVINPSIS